MFTLRVVLVYRNKRGHYKVRWLSIARRLLGCILCWDSPPSDAQFTSAALCFIKIPVFVWGLALNMQVRTR